MKNILIYLIVVFFISFFCWGCKKEKKEKKETLNVLKLGTTDFNASIWGIRGFNIKGNPIIAHSNKYLYEWNDIDNTFNKLGGQQNFSPGDFCYIVQDNLGNYFCQAYDLFMLNKNTDTWDTVKIADGFKSIVANQNGDIVAFVDNSSNGGDQSFYLKKGNETQWQKIADLPSNFNSELPQYRKGPKFLSNTGLLFFNQYNSAGQIDGQGNYSNDVLDINTKTFRKLCDPSHPSNFNYANQYGFSCDYISPQGHLYVGHPANPNLEIYKLDANNPNAVFEKITYFDKTYSKENGIAMDIDLFKINESTGKIKVALHCYNGFNPHWNLGHADIGNSLFTLLEHDAGINNNIFSSPNGNVFIQKNNTFYLWK